MEMGRALELLGTFTAEQWGMVTSKQAKSLSVDGVTVYRLKEAGFLEQVRRGVYAATTAVETEAREEQAAWLALSSQVPSWERALLDESSGVLSHHTAARLHGLGELVNDRIAFIVPRRRTSRDHDLWFKIDTLVEDDIVLLDGLPVTTVLRTVCDLLDQHVDASHIATIIRQAVGAGQLQLDTLAERIGVYARRYRVRPGDGEALLEHLLAQIGLTIADLAVRPTPPRVAATAAQLAVPSISASAQNALANLWSNTNLNAQTRNLLQSMMPTVDMQKMLTPTIVQKELLQNAIKSATTPAWRGIPTASRDEADTTERACGAANKTDADEE